MAKEKQKEKYHYEGGYLVSDKVASSSRKTSQILRPERLTSEKRIRSEKIVKGKLVRTSRKLTPEEVMQRIERKVKYPTQEKAITDVAAKRIAVARGRAFKTGESHKTITKRAKAVSGVLSAMGITGGSQKYAGAGRPRGTYKYGMPIHMYKKQMTEKRAMYNQYLMQQKQKLAGQGFNPEQVQQLQQAQRIENVIQQPQQTQQMQQQMQMVPQQTQERFIQDMPQPKNVADEELEFAKWRAERTIHPNTQRILDSVRRIQNKGHFDNIENDRRHRERRLLSRNMNLLRAHENMTKVDMNFTGVPEDNILLAPSIWSQSQSTNILKPRPSHVLSGENRIKFF